jgi:hypothetical protein
MKSIITLLLISSSFLLSAQSNSSVGFIGGIDYTYRHIGGADSQSAIFKEVRNSEKGNINWRFGVELNEIIKSTLVLKTGARLMSLGYHKDINVNFGDLRWGLQHDGNGGYYGLSSGGDLSSGENSYDFTVSNNYWFIELPLVVRYEFSDKKFTPYAEAGVAPAYYLLDRNIVTSDGEREVTTTTPRESNSPVQRIQLEGILAFGFNYNIKESIQLFGQPTFRYHLTKMWDTDLKEHLWSAGLEIGVRKLLN